MNGYSWKGLVLFSQESKGKGKRSGEMMGSVRMEGFNEQNDI